MDDIERRRLVDEMFSLALACDSNARAEFLRTQFPGCSREVYSEVEELLEINDQSTSGGVHAFGELTTNIAKLVSSSRTPPPELVAGTRLGQFKIVRILGAGGFGTVFLAERCGEVSQRVAIKVLQPGRAVSEKQLSQFENERQLIANLAHENIARFLDSGRTPDGLPYFVMEFIDGKPVTEYCDENHVDARERLLLFLAICRGLSFAHENDVIHRDLKPANILVSDTGQPKLLDFGVAKLIESHSDDSGTDTDALPMTLRYASPEQVRGERITVRSDVYSLGVILHELLTGYSPDDDKAASKFELTKSIAEREADAPSLSLEGRTDAVALAASRNTDVRSLARYLRGDLENIVLKTLAKEASRRYAAVSELADDLERFLEHRPVKASTPTMANRLKKAFLRQPATYLLAIVLVCAFAVMGTISGLHWRHQSRERLWRTVELPSVDRLIDELNLIDAMAKLETGLSLFPDDPELLRRIGEISFPVEVVSQPLGATVEIRSVHQPGDEWQFLGKTPFTRRLPKDSLHCRVTHPEIPQELVVLQCIRHWTKTITFDLDEFGASPTEMVLVPGVPVKKVRDVGEVQQPTPFHIDVCEVTNQSYKAFVDAGGYSNEKYWTHPFFDEHGEQVDRVDAMKRFCNEAGDLGPANWKNGMYPEEEALYPVRGISWYEASAYAEFVGKSLPTYPEWIVAAYSYSQEPYVAMLSNLESKEDGPVSVGEYRGIGPFGTVDMAGNVREWTRSHNGDSRRYTAGGCWEDPNYMFWSPDLVSPWSRSNQTGFRCVKHLPGTKLGPTKPFTYEHEFAQPDPCSDEVFSTLLETYVIGDQELHAQTLEDRQVGDFRCKLVSIDSVYDDGDPIPGYLYLPDTQRFSPPFQTIVYFPGSYAIGKKPFDVDKIPEDVEMMLNRGRAVFWPMYWGTYQRGTDKFTSPFPNSSLDYREAIVRIALDFKRSLDYLCTQPDLVQADSLAYYGFSWGAAVGPIMLAVDDRIQAAVLCSGGITPAALPDVDSTNFAPRVQSRILMLNGEYDAIVPFESAQQPLMGLLRSKTDLGHKHVVIVGEGHSLPQYTRAIETIKWLDQVASQGFSSGIATH